MSDYGDPTAPRPPAPPPLPPPPGGSFPPRQPPPPPPPPGPFGAAPHSDVTGPSAIADAGAWTSYGPPGSPSPYGPVSDVGQRQYAAMRLPRPKVARSAGIMVTGGVIAVVGSFLPWYSQFGNHYTGFSSSGSDTNDGPVFLTLGAVLICFGIALLSAKKILAITIIGIAVAALVVVLALADLGKASDLQNDFDDVTIGPGLYLCLLGGGIAFVAAVAATVKRRR